MPQISSTDAKRDYRREADPLFRREMRERWRRPLTLLQLLLFASALAYVGYNIYYTTVPLSEFVAPSSLSGTGRGFFFALAQWHALAWIPGGLLLAAPTLAAERERGHLTDWVLAGLTPTNIVRAKWRALAGFVLVMVCVPFPVFALCFPLGGVAPLDFLAVFALTIAIALNSVALGVLISANCATVTRALWGALVTSGIALFVGVAFVPVFLGESWLAPLIFALSIIWLPIVWISAGGATFESEVEKHIKNAEERFNAPIIEPPAPIIAPAPDMQARAKPQIALPPTAATPGFSQTESLILRAAENNAIAHRDVKRRLISRRTNALYSESDATNTALWVWIVTWLAVGAAGLISLKVTGTVATDGGLFQSFVFIYLMAAMGFAALDAAPGFTRERAQKMLSALQMTALSPLDIVRGKITGVLLLCAQYFAGALLSLCVIAFSIGPCSALMLAIFGVACVAFTAMGSLTLSLWSRKTEIVALGALASMAALWWVTPVLFINNNFSLFFHAPTWLERLWLAPIRVVMRPASDAQLALALGQLAAICLCATFILGALCVAQLRRTRAEEEETGWLQRDLSRGWK